MHLLTVIDRYTRWTEAIHLSSMKSKDCSNALLLHWVTQFGVPYHLTSNWGTHFTLSLWNDMAIALGIQLHQTTAYHLQSNGLMERLHQGLKTSLCAHLNGLSWTEHLP